MLSQKSTARGFVCKTCVRKGRLCALPDVATPATICSADMSCESASTCFAFGYFCWLLLPYLHATVFHKVIVGFFFRVLFCGSNAYLAYSEGAYNLSKTKMLANSSWPAKIEVCWSQLSFLTSSCNILITYPCWNEWFFISNFEYFFSF